jgi:hypothetical protein
MVEAQKTKSSVPNKLWLFSELGSIRKTSLWLMSHPCAKNMAGDERKATLMVKSTVSELRRRCGKQDYKYGSWAPSRFIVWKHRGGSTYPPIHAIVFKDFRREANHSHPGEA